MDAVLWQAFAGTRGGPNRARILRLLAERPKNANQLATDLGLAYNTVRHHLEVLEQKGILTSGGSGYGTVYLPSDQARNNWATVDRIVSAVEETG